MNFRHIARIAVAATALILAQGASAQEDWTYGIGTGFSSFSLDGDIGFPTAGGGVIFDGDLDNGDTADLFESAFGAAFFADNGTWRINASYRTLTLEDNDGGFEAEWDNSAAEFSVEYTFATVDNNRFAVLAGARYTDHDWTFKDPTESVDVGDDWTDALLGLTHSMRINDRWSWSNRVDYGFGDSEGTWFASTALNWQPYTHWVFNANFTYLAAEFGDKDDIAQPDFYYYDVDQPAFGIGVAYVW